MRHRIRSIDGLRGVAALVVVFHHVLLTNANLAAPYSIAGDLRGPLWAKWLLYSPLHLLWDGTIAVFLFFVLSGYVLALPWAQGSPPRWARYYPKRILRLYLPVAAAVVIAIAWMLLVPRGRIHGVSWWLNWHKPLTGIGVLQDLTLVWGKPGATNGVLWSLKWEVWFSLLLPAFVVGGRWLRRLPPLLPCVALAYLSGVSLPGVAGEALTYLPMFGCGVVLAFSRHDLRLPTSRWAWTAVGAGTVVALNSGWLMYLLPGHRGTRSHRAVLALEILAAVFTVVLAGRAPGLRRVLERPVPQWLGSRSFSLYLVHEPIVVSLALLRGGKGTVLLTLAVAVPLAVAAAELFHRLVERPSLRLAGRFGAGAVLDPPASLQPAGQEFLATIP